MLFSNTINALIFSTHILTVQAHPTLKPRSSQLNHRKLSLQHTAAIAFADAAPNTKTDNFVKLTRRGGSQRSSTALEQIRRANNIRKRDAQDDQPLKAVLGGAEYITDIIFGAQNVSLVVDTGSSDTWLIQDGFKCVNSHQVVQPATSCAFGPTYKGSFSDKKIPDVNFNISYGDGEFVTGDFGAEDITIAGITVPQQTVSYLDRMPFPHTNTTEAALGTFAYWNGDNISSGLIGLAYPSITSQYSGSDPHRNNRTSQNEYDPIFTTMYKTGLSSAMFSMALERDTGGYMAFGGLPPVNYTGDFASTPIQLTKLSTGKSLYAFYTITPDAISYQGAPAINTEQYIVDSGTTLIYAPSFVTSAINKQFNPPAKLKSGNWQVDCNATAPKFGINVGGTVFYISPKDLILHDESGICISGIQDGGSSGPFVLGDVFMANALVIFDVGAAEMRFAANYNY